MQGVKLGFFGDVSLQAEAMPLLGLGMVPSGKITIELQAEAGNKKEYNVLLHQGAAETRMLAWQVKKNMKPANATMEIVEETKDIPEILVSWMDTFGITVSGSTTTHKPCLINNLGPYCDFWRTFLVPSWLREGCYFLHLIRDRWE